MNQSFLNPFSTPSIPESVHQVLGARTETPCLCARFNPKGLFAGQYIASARADCAVAIYDVETGGMLRILQGHVKPLTAIAWSDTGRYLASASADWNVVLWDLKSQPALKVRTVRFDGPVASVDFAPQSSKLLVVTLESQQAIVVDLRRRRKAKTKSLIIANGTNGSGTPHHDLPSSSKLSSDSWQTRELRLDLGEIYNKTISLGHSPEDGDMPAPLPPITTAKFHPSGAYIFAGTNRGEILVFSLLLGGRLVSRFSAAGASAIREIALDKSGRSLVVNSNDRSIRIVSISIIAVAAAAVTSSVETPPNLPEINMHIVHRFQDLVNRTPWNGIGFSGDGEYVYAGAAHKAAHNIYVWDRGAGALDKILEGPKEPLVDADWHPTRPLLLSVGLSGSINIWFTPNAENWSAYAPGFEELEENIVYEEGEEEFDLEDEDEVSRRKRDEEEVDVDVLSVGPLPGASGVTPMQEIVHPQGAGLDSRPANAVEDDDWEYEWEYDPERLQESFALYTALEEEGLDEDAMDAQDRH